MVEVADQDLLSAPVLARDDVVTLTSCSVVNQSAFANNNGLPIGALVDFKPPASLQLPQISRQPARCRACAAYINPYCKTSNVLGAWQCSLCGQGNVKKDFEGAVLTGFSELCEESVEYVFAAPTQSPPTAAQPHLVLVIDATLDSSMLEGMATGLIEALSSLEASTRISVITFDSVLSLHSLTSDSNFSFTMPGSKPLDLALLAAYLSGEVSGVGGVKAVFTLDIKLALPRILTLLQTIRPMEEDQPMVWRARCLGLAVEAGLRIMSASSPVRQKPATTSRYSQRLPRGSRLVLITCGPCTRGPGTLSQAALESGAAYHERVSGLGHEYKQQATAAQEYIASCVDLAKALAVPVDIILGGGLKVNAPLLSMLSRDTQGSLMLHRGFGPTFGAGLRSCFSRCFGSSAVLDCFVSDGLQLVQWLGPVNVLQSPEPEDVGLSMASDRRLSGSACSVARLQEGHGVALRMEVVRDLKAPAVLLQVVLQFIDPSIGGRLVQRVTTRRISVVSHIKEYLDSVNATATSVLLAKKAVLDAKRLGALWESTKADELRLSLRAQLALIASRCCPEVQLSKGMLGLGARKVRQWPRSLTLVAHTLYQLQRAVMLGPPTHAPSDWARVHADDRLISMNTLLYSSSIDVVRMLLPKLMCWRDGTFKELPPIDILAHHFYNKDIGRFLMLDCGVSVIVLPRISLAVPNSGESLTGMMPLSDEQLSDLKALVMLPEAGAWQAPEVRFVGQSEMREVYARLFPAGKDTISDLEGLHPGIRAVLKDEDIDQFLKVSVGQNGADLTLLQWCSAAGVMLSFQTI
ncbi:hypothetical protein CEUSTIGMA_g5153.t1 [Chlamydomonas eustigma]|uniref:Protein transport protein SEC23 n=1 Tax=Chlamydomonas eustigma TaxID=1157962 RepID=A0A250X4M5_9CHLO|nr:hypothetical protein CEUSTIGMA_g5153.t1 [Chlamydomonas eustigma]|eukprot:GAX77710.1 hypothetical protein CEUSTIGMA_g5153.t1 [Chlamydomonas eustigma]